MVKNRKSLRQIPELDNQLARILELLLKHKGEIVERKHLIDEIWFGNEYVGRTALTKNIWRLRKALKRNPNQSYRIETIPKKGYSLVEVNSPLSGLFLKSMKVPVLALIGLTFLIIFLALYAVTTENIDYILVPAG